MPRDANCERCILNESSHNVCVWGQGDGEGFIIGEAPGREEARTGRPFMGKSGLFGRPILASFGLDDPYITNAAKCRPPDNRKPEPSELKACKPFLLEEIEAKKPKAILLWGAIAMKSVLGRTGITEMNGQVVEKDGQTYVCCFHPAYVLRDPSKEDQFRMAIGRYAQVLKGTFTSEMPPWRPIDTNTFDEFIADWDRATSFGFDLESAGAEDGSTEGLEWYKDGFVITSISFSLMVNNEEKNWGLAMPGHPSSVLDEEFAKLLLEELTRTQGKKRAIGQNAKYDNLCLLRKYGVRFRLDSDSMLAHHTIDENSAHGLKQTAREHCGAPDYDLTGKEKKNTRRVPIRRLLGYNCADSAYSRRLDTIFLGKMDEQERWLYEKVVMPSARMFQDAESDGLYVDIKFLDAAADEAAKQMKTVEKQLNKLAKRTINWNAPGQVAQVLYGDLGLVPTVFTDKVNPATGEQDTPSTSEEALLDLDHPVVKLLAKYREHHKFQSTYSGFPNEEGGYSGGWREFMVGPRLYISTKIHGTVTGRYSSRIHSTPRDSTIRSAIIAPPGWTFVQFDLSQAELRIVAAIARDPTLIQLFNTGTDVHWSTLMDVIAASDGTNYLEKMFQTCRAVSKRKLDFVGALDVLREMGPDEAVRILPFWKEERKKAKSINFGFVFGLSAPGFIDYAKLKYGFEPTLPESTMFRNTFFNKYGTLINWHERQKKLVRADGFVRYMSGRRRRLPGIYSSDRSLVAEAERQAINSPVQGYIGDHKAMILVELHETFPRDVLRVKFEQHDSGLLWVRTDALNDVLPQVKHIAENPKLVKEAGIRFPVKMEVDIEVGPWGRGTKWRG